VAENWVKYRSSGAIFRTKEDVRKVYGLEEHLYQQLEEWMYFPKEDHTKQLLREESVIENELHLKKPPEIKPLIMLGINTADSMELLEVSGIGPFYAGAIVKYRKRLGGYRDIQQLMELYKMDSLKFNKMISQLYLDTVTIERINLNTAEFKEILRHPYINYETTKYIVNKRNKLGKFAALYQLKDSVNMQDSLYQKLLPYIELND
jgi:DNA uptake protein ComE-like DNA-binding protein